MRERGEREERQGETKRERGRNEKVPKETDTTNLHEREGKVKRKGETKREREE